MKICFFGVGGVGGYFGSVITERFQNEHDIYFIARGKHKDIINKKGLTLKKDGGKEIINVVPKACTDNTNGLPIFDIIILSVKGYDLASAAEEISKISNNKTIILPLLNGVDIYERIRAYLSKGIVLRACVYVGTYIERPGIIYQKGGNCKISIGKDPFHPDFYPEALLSVLEESKIDFDWEDDVSVSIWSKYMFIAAYGLVGSAYNKTLGEILKDESLGKLVKSIMREIEMISKKMLIPLDADIVETSFSKAKQFPYETKTSFHRDVESKGKINEGDLFGGTLIRYGLANEIPVSNTVDVYNKLLSRFE